MNIKITKMTLNNFKGIKHLEINFSDETSIFGRNASGKTTIMDGFLFLLFGKDSKDRKDFEIKTLDSEGKAIPFLDHEVSAELLLDDHKKTLQRILREKWTKPRGQAEKVFEGHETVFFVDSVPCSQKDYNKEIDSICQESLFKLLTNPEYFPSQNWTMQRQILMSMVPEITYEDVVASLPKDVSVSGIEYLQNSLNEGKTLDKIKAQIASEKKNIRDEISQIPARIDEITKSLPEEPNWNEIEKGIEKARKQITDCDRNLTDVSKQMEEKNAAATKLRKQLFTVNDLISTLENSARSAFATYRNSFTSQLRDFEFKHKDLSEEINRRKSMINAKNRDIEAFIVSKDQMLKQYVAIRSEHFIEGPTCSTCGQLLPEEMVESAKVAFENSKAQRLSSNVKQGKEIVFHILTANRDIEIITNVMADLTKQLAELKAPENGQLDEESFIKDYLSKHGHQDLALEREKLQKEFEATPEVGVDTSDILSAKNTAQDELSSLTKQMALKSQIESGKARIKQLHQQLSTLSQQLAGKEKTEYAIQVFSATKMGLVEQRVNQMFQLVKFRMFETQINGGIVDTCVALVDGVPYPSLNDAMKVAAGIDIINVLSNYHGNTCPIWIDNRESVTEIPETKSQVINLFVSAEDKKLRIQ